MFEKDKFLYNNLLFFISTTTYVFFYFYLRNDIFLGIGIIQCAFILLNQDLTGNFYREFFKILSINLFIVACTFLSSINLFSGLLINFISIFLISYILTYTLKSSMSYPFLFTYIFLLIHNTTIILIKNRFIIITLGSIGIMLLQYIINKGKSKKIIKKNLELLIKSTTNYIIELSTKKTTSFKLKHFELYIDTIIQTIYAKRNNYFHLNEKDRLILNITLYIERLLLDLNELIHTKDDIVYKEFLDELLIILPKLKITLNSEKDLKNLEKYIDIIIQKYMRYKDRNYPLCEMIENLKTLNFSLIDIENLSNIPKIKIPNRVQFDNVFNLKFFRFKSIKFSYSLRVATLISISFFIISYFNFQEGKWLILTIFPLVQPYTELSQKKIPIKFKGTLVGILGFFITTTFIKNVLYLGIIYFILYYLYLNLKESIIKTTLLTTIVLGLVSLSEEKSFNIALYRLLFISIGILVSYLATRFIIPFSIKESIKDFSLTHYMLTKDILINSFSNDLDATLITEINDKLFISKLLENKILSHNYHFKNQVIKKYIYNQRILNNDLYFLIFSLYKSSHDKKILRNLKEKFYLASTRHSIKYYSESTLINDIKKIEKLVEDKNLNNKEKILFVNSYKIIKRIELSNNLLIAINKL